MADTDNQEDDGGEERDWSIGPKVEQFYFSYRSGDENLGDLIESLCQLEHHIPQTILGETNEVITEIISDCQRKTAQIIKAPYAENVRGIITAIRKKLVTKVSVSLDSETSAQHGQRHLNSLLELLGLWSNMIDHIRSLHYYISGTLLRIIITQLHSRIIEMALECFQKFREDKQIDSWHIRIIESENGKNTFSISALDFLLSQMSAMREIVQQYYKFLDKIFLSINYSSNDTNGKKNFSLQFVFLCFSFLFVCLFVLFVCLCV